MEELTKHQLILVALLVSFVTSIATGIVTVALMEQAPQSVTQTVTRVIQETVASAVPSVVSTNTATAAGAGTTQVVKVVSDDSTLESVVAKGSQSIMRVQANVSPYPPVYLGLGTLVSSAGQAAGSTAQNSIASSFVVASANAISQGSSYQGILGGGNILDGATTTLDLVGQNQADGLAFFTIAPVSASAGGASTSTSSAGSVQNGGQSQMQSQSQPQLSLKLETLGNSDSLVVGQSIVVLGGDDHDIISRGVIVGLLPDATGLIEIQTDAVPVEQGAQLLDLNGNVIGFEMSGSTAAGGARFLPSNIVKMQLQEILASANATSSSQ